MTTSSERAYSFIKQCILEGKFGSGERLPEDRIASELGVSRTPIRDALRMLLAEGLVTNAPNSGARVAAWSEDELSEISQLRVMLEGFAAELAAAKITREELDELAQLSAKMENGARSGTTDGLSNMSEANLAFHRKIVLAAGNSRLLYALEPLWHFPVVIRKFAMFTPERLERSLSHHREILEALRERDAGWAGSIMRTHIQSARAADTTLAKSADTPANVA